MIRTLCFTILGLVLFCGTSNADFVIDDFTNTATSGGGAVTSNSTTDSNITVEITDQGGGTLQSNANDYGFLALTGDFFTLTYDFGGMMFDLLPGVDGDTYIRSLGFPAAVTIGNLADWSFDASTDGGANFDSLGVELTGATDVQLRFTYNGGGISSLTYGGSGNSLVAVPEPTAALMLGSIVALGYVRRRRRG